MNRLYAFVGFVVLIALASYPFVQELRHVSEVKESKSDFQEMLDERNPAESSVRRRSEAWNKLSEQHKRELRDLGFYPASLPNSRMGFTLRNFEEEQVRLRDFTGDWILLNFWATWCPPCRMEMPSLDKLQTTFSDNLTVLTINVEQTRSTVKRFKNNYEFDLRVLMDSEGKVTDQYGATGLPESWLITPSGKPLAKLDGPLEWHQSPATGTFERLFRSN